MLVTTIVRLWEESALKLTGIIVRKGVSGTSPPRGIGT